MHQSHLRKLLWLWLILVSSDEATRSITTHVPPGQDVSPSHPGYFPTLLPPSPPPEFYQASLANFCYPLILLDGVGRCKKQVLYKNKTHNLARLQMQTSWPWVHLTNHKATISPQEERVYIGSFLIRNKFYKTGEKKNSLIWFLNRNYWSKRINDVCLYSIS